MKTYFLAILMMVVPCLLHSQDLNGTVRLKQINIVKTNYQNSKDGEIVNKTVVFQEGKIQTITT
jgi:hypothetical protein